MKCKYVSLALCIAIEDMPESAALIIDCFRGVTVLHAYRNKWIASDVWVDIINSRYDISDNLKFSSTQLNRDDA